MRKVATICLQKGSRELSCVIMLVFAALASNAQSGRLERNFPQSKATIEKTLKELQSSVAGRLPVLDGFAVQGEHSLDRFQRAYYQCSIQVSSAPSAGSLVRVSVKITAWYDDPVPSKSGYRVLASNGRLESDFLDRLGEALDSRGSTPVAGPTINSRPVQPSTRNDATVPAISAPTPRDTIPGEPIVGSKPASASSVFKRGTLGNEDPTASLTTRRVLADKHVEELTKQAKNLQEILHNQAHPNNLIVVKKSGTPIVVSPSEGAKVLFLATAEDEFEILDTNANWVHVRISGLSRGWIRRSSVEMPQASTAESRPEKLPTASTSASSNKSPFQVENEQIASFPGEWAPLRGKTVKIISVQKANQKTADTGARAKLEFAKSLFDKEYVELSQAASTAAGVVLIFDSEDGGMLAASLPVLQQWKAGSLSDEALWRRCFFDPPEMVGSDAIR